MIRCQHQVPPTSSHLVQPAAFLSYFNINLCQTIDLPQMSDTDASIFGSRGCSAPTNPNLNTKEKFLRAWLAGETNIGRFFYDWNSGSQADIVIGEPNSRPSPSLQSINPQSGPTPVAYPPPYPVAQPKSTGGSSSSSRQTFWSCRLTLSKPDSPPQLSLVHAPGTIISSGTPPELFLAHHTRSHDNFCHSEGAPPFSALALQSQDGFYFESDPCNPSRVRLPQSSIPLSQLQVAGHCPAIVDEIYDRFSPSRVSLLWLIFFRNQC